MKNAAGGSRKALGTARNGNGPWVVAGMILFALIFTAALSFSIRYAISVIKTDTDERTARPEAQATPPGAAAAKTEIAPKTAGPEE